MSDSQVLRAELEAARNFANRYAALCARELLERNETGILPSGRVRELARLCSYAGPHALQVAEKLVTDVAIEMVAHQEVQDVCPVCHLNDRSKRCTCFNALRDL